jgi:hypothetical protein
MRSLDGPEHRPDPLEIEPKSGSLAQPGEPDFGVLRLSDVF